MTTTGRHVRQDNPERSTGAPPPELVAARAEIDRLDTALVDWLAARFAVTRRVGRLKADQGLPPADPARQTEQIDRVRALAEHRGVEPDLAAAIPSLIMAEVVHQHQQVERRPG